MRVARSRELVARGRPAALVARVADGAKEAWLNVNVDNPAAGLYRKLGFTDRGRRARFRCS